MTPRKNCLGVQRVLLHKAIYHAFRERFVAHVARLSAGASTDEATDVCALITEREAARVARWIDEAVARGARVPHRRPSRGSAGMAEVLEEIPEGVCLDCDEVYGPVVSLYAMGSLDEAIARANRVRYGLHAAIFTERLRDAFEAIRRLDCGGVLVNDSTDYRLDVMPFGSTKLSGIGRDGVRFAVEAMTETKYCLA